MAVDERDTVDFGLRIDEVVPDATGTISLDVVTRWGNDPKKGNNTAKLIVNPAGGTDATPPADDGGSLPITGAPTAPLVGVGAALLVGGAGLLVVRRRRTRFTT
jgi:LPXTG-motif cell wall-anchored protein